MEYTEEEIQLLKNLKARGASVEEAKKALQASRRASSVKQEQEQINSTDISDEEKAVINRMKDAGRSSEEAKEMLDAMRKLQKDRSFFNPVAGVDEFMAIAEKYPEIQEKSSFEQIENKTPMDYVAGGIAAVGKPIVKAAEFVEEKAITPAVEATVGAMDTITAPLQSGLRNLIGEEKIADMQGGIDNALNSAGAATVKWWESMDNDTQNRLKMTFEALEPILMVTGAAKAKTALKGAAKDAGKTALQLLKGGDDAAVKTVLKEGKKAEKLVKSALKKDKLLEKPFIREITNATDDELKGFDKMLNIARSNVGKVGADVLPEDIVGKEITKQAKFIYDEMSKIGKNKGKVVDKIGNDKIDVSDAYNSFVDGLEKMGVKVKRKGQPNKDTFYRGGGEFDPKLTTDTGTSFSSERKIAEDFAENKGGRVYEYSFSPDAKTLKYEDVPGVKYKYIDSYSPELDTGDMQIWKDIEVEYAKAAKWAKENNYDIVELPLENELRVVNPKVVKSAEGSKTLAGFQKSKVRDNDVSQKNIQKVLDWFDEGNMKSIKDVDNYRSNLFDTLDLDKAQPTLSSLYKNTLEKVRANLAKPIEAKAPRYAKLNKQYAQTRNSFTDITKMLGFKGKIDEIAKEATRGGEIARRLLGRASAKPAKIMDQLQATSKKLGYKPNVSIKKMASFAERMSQKFGTPQATSFESQITSGVTKAKQLADVASDLTMGGVKGVGKQALNVGKAVKSKFATSAADKGTQKIKDLIGATRKIQAKKALPSIPAKKSVPKLISGLAKSTAKDIAKDPKAAIRGAAKNAKKAVPLLGILGASKTGRSLGF